VAYVSIISLGDRAFLASEIISPIEQVVLHVILRERERQERTK